MKNRGLSFKLNIFHLSNFLTVVFLLLLINFFAVRKLLFVEVEKNLSTSCKFLYGHLEDTRREVELTAHRISTYFQNDENLMEFDPVRDQLRRIVTHVKDVRLLGIDSGSCKLIHHYADNIPNVTDELFDTTMVSSFFHGEANEAWKEWTDEEGRVTRFYYLYKVQQKKVLVIQFNINFIIRNFSDYDLDKGGFPIVFNVQENLIYHPLMNTHYISDFKTLPERILSLTPNEFFVEKQFNRGKGYIIKKAKLHADDEPYVSYMMYEPDWGWYITVNQPYSQVYSDLFHYMKSVGIWFLIAMLLMSYLVIMTNYFQTKSLREIMFYLIDSKYLQLKVSSHENETTVIRRGIDLFQNQLEQYSKSIEKNAVDKKKIEHDLELAKKLQRNILPAPSTFIKERDDFEIFALSESAFDIGGDLFDYFFLDDDHLFFTVGDVSGKGIQASLFMIFTQTLLRSQAKVGIDSGTIVENLNNKVIEENLSDLFVTLFIGIVNIRTGTFNFCNAGHCIPVLIHPQGKLNDISDMHGIPIGIYANRSYKSTTIQLSEGDMVLVYTDGVVDAKDENGMRFSEDVLKYNLIGSWFLNTEQTVTKIKESIEWFKGNVSPEDDLTLLAFKYTRKPKLDPSTEQD